MHFAAGEGHDRCVKQLIELDADVNAMNIGSATPLTCAIIEKRNDVLDVLVKNGANFLVNSRNTYEPIELAVTMQNDYAVKLFTAEKSNQNIRFLNGNTLFHRMGKTKPLENLYLLVDNGFDPLLGNDDGDTALHIMLREREGVDGINDIFPLLIDKLRDINITNKQGHTLLDEAVLSCHVGLVQLLIAWGADINNGAADFDGNVTAPLHQALMPFVTKPKMVNNVLCVNAAYIMPLYLRERKFRLPDDQVFNLLIDAGADVNMKNIKGDTPLHIAARGGGLDLVLKLIEN